MDWPHFVVPGESQSCLEQDTTAPRASAALRCGLEATIWGSYGLGKKSKTGET